MTTDHSNCSHTRDSKGRAACRKAGGPQLFAFQVTQAIIAEAEALCADCFSQARVSASENLDLDYSDDRVIETAREYLFDRSALSGCTAHAHLLG